MNDPYIEASEALSLTQDIERWAKRARETLAPLVPTLDALEQQHRWAMRAVERAILVLVERDLRYADPARRNDRAERDRLIDDVARALLLGREEVAAVLVRSHLFDLPGRCEVKRFVAEWLEDAQAGPPVPEQLRATERDWQGVADRRAAPPASVAAPTARRRRQQPPPARPASRSVAAPA